MNTPCDDDVISDCLGPLMMHLRRTQAAYKNYLAEGKTFRRALVLWDSNTAMRDLLLLKGHLLSDTMQEAATAIIAHLDIWASLFVEHREAEQPKPDDVFAFENEDRFPSASESALKACYRQHLDRREDRP